MLGDGLDLEPPASLDLPPVSRQGRKAWGIAAAGLILVTCFNLLWTFREAFEGVPAVRDTLDKVGLLSPDQAQPFRDTSRIHIISRDLHAHPSREDVLVLSATFVNLADQSQPYPALMLTLKDQDNRPLSGRVFAPREYLRSKAEPKGLLQPGSHVPVLLEFQDPGDAAVGFELAFH